MEVERRERPSIQDISPTTLAIAAVGVSIALIVISFGGVSQLSFVTGPGRPMWSRIASLLTIASITVAIVVGVALLRRGDDLVASGVFLGLGVLLALRLASEAVALFGGGIFPWKTIALLVLEGVRCALLFLAASRARREEPSAAT